MYTIDNVVTGRSYLSDDGIYFATTYWGGNLVPKSTDKNLEMVIIWKDGQKFKSITLGEIIKDFSKLQETTSHYQWGVFTDINDSNVYAETVEGHVVINIKTGNVQHKN